jgi:hypothetical protein
VVAEHGYRTTLDYFRKNAARCRRLFAKHGIGMADPAASPDVPRRECESRCIRQETGGAGPST